MAAVMGVFFRCSPPLSPFPRTYLTRVVACYPHHAPPALCRAVSSRSVVVTIACCAARRPARGVVLEAKRPRPLCLLVRLRSEDPHGVKCRVPRWTLPSPSAPCGSVCARVFLDCPSARRFNERSKMSASPIARQATQSIPVRRVMLSDPSQLPNDYSTTPGGTLYSTTPGGMHILPVDGGGLFPS